MAGAVRRLQGQGKSCELAGASMTDLSRQIIGSWKMLSWTYEVLETGVHDALGKDPKDYIRYLPDGRMMVHHVRFGKVATATSLILPRPPGGAV